MGTRLLTKSDIVAVLSMSDCIDAVEAAFLAHAKGETIPPGVLASHVSGGGFHVKTAGMRTSRAYYVAKVNANFPDNPRLRNLPTVQGALLLYDAVTGSLLAVMDSGEITRLRTAAASAVAARHMSRRDSETMTICGCGLQGRAHVDAMMAVRPFLTRTRAFGQPPLPGSGSVPGPGTGVGSTGGGSSTTGAGSSTTGAGSSTHVTVIATVALEPPLSV